MSKKFKLHWLTGQVEEVEGDNIADAFNKAGYSSGALPSLDYYEEIKEEREVKGNDEKANV